MVKGSTRRHSPESVASSQGKSNDVKKVVRARRGAVKEPIREDSSVSESMNGDDSRNGADPDINGKKNRSPAKRRLPPKEATPSESENSDEDDLENDDEDDVDDEDHNDEDNEDDDVEDGSDNEGSEESVHEVKRGRGNKRKVNNDESNDSPAQENGKRRRQARVKTETPSRASSKSPAAVGTSPRGRGRPRRSGPITNLDDATKGRMSFLLDAITQYSKNNKKLIEVFYGLPPKAQYPDYYDVVSEPIDMYTIEERVEEHKYRNERALMYDLALMFKNAKSYNEEDSEVYRDANLLEQHLKTTWRKMVTEKDEKPDPMYLLFESIFDFEDETGRQLIVPFMKLPTRSEFPSYYEVIRRPIDVARIREKLFSEAYILFDDLVGDFRLLFDNTCKFNEPDSQLYRDALALLRFCNRKRQELLGINDGPQHVGNGQGSAPIESPPDALRAIHDMMRDLLTFMHQCRIPHVENGSDNVNAPEFYVKRFADLIPTSEDTTTSSGLSKLPPLAAFDRVRQNVEQNRYRRLDRFQDDIFEILHNVRTLAGASTAAFQAAVHLQEEFIKRRDALTESGRRLYSPASQYGVKELQADVERDMGSSSTPMPTIDEAAEHSDEGEEDSQEAITSQPNSLTSISCGDKTVALDDYVFVKAFSTGSSEPRTLIVQVKKLWEDEANKQTMISGDVFLRPEDTFHMVNRKFYPNEVFRSDSKHTGPSTAITGKCVVLLPRVYFRFSIDGLAEKDVFICDTRYNSRSRSMTKLGIRGWKGVFTPRESSASTEETDLGLTVSSGITLVRRSAPLRLTRNVPSVFAVKQQEQAAASDAASTTHPNHPTMGVLDKFRENIPLVDPAVPPPEGVQVFEQMLGPLPGRTAVKLGDFVYVAVTNHNTIVLRVERIFTQAGAEGVMPYVCGTRLFLPPEVMPGPHDPASRELLLSIQLETHPLGRVIGRCLVLANREYCILRCPEILERDTFLCENECLPPEGPNMPVRLRKVMSVAVPNLKKLSPAVIEDEVFFFPKPIVPRKTVVAALPIPHHVQLGSTSSSSVDSHRLTHPIGDDSSLGGPDELAKMAAMNSEDYKMTHSPSSSLTHSDGHRKGHASVRGRGGKSSNRGNGPVSGWTIFSRHMHHDKEFQSLMAGKEFPERAKIIAEKWRTLPAAERAKFIEEARIEEESRRQRRVAAAAAMNEQSVSSIDAAKSPAPMMYQGPPPQMQGQSMIGPNGQMMMPPQQPYYPDQIQAQVHPGMQPNFGAPTGYFPPRPPVPQQFPGQQPFQPLPGQFPPMQPMMQPHYGNMGPQMMPPQGFVPPQQNFHPPFMNGHHPHGGIPPDGFPQQPPPQPQPSFHGGPPQNFPGPMPPAQMGFSPQQPPMHQMMQNPMGHHPHPGQPPLPPQPQPFSQPAIPHQGVNIPQPVAPQTPAPNVNQAVAPPEPLKPIVHAVPPRPNKLVHSEAFLRYLDGLGAGADVANSRPFISDWSRSLTVTEGHVAHALNNNDTRARLTSMVGPGVISNGHTNGNANGHHESRSALVGALYKLNSDLISDSLNLSRVLDYQQL